MKNKNTVWLAIALVVSVVLPALTQAALPFAIRSGHPRVYIDQARVNELRQEIAQDQAFNGVSFPQTAGTLSFDLFVPPPPSSPDRWPQTVVGFWPNASIFDEFDAGRNHIYIRHRDRSDSSSYYPCGFFNNDQAAIQIGFQAQSSIFYSREVCIRTNAWVTVTVYWDTVTSRLGHAVAGDCLSGCAGSASSIPQGWVPNHQRFRFAGRTGYNPTSGQNDLGDRFDNIELHSDSAASNLLASYPLNEGTGVYAVDASGNGKPGRLEANVKWASRLGDGGPSPAIEITGSTYPFSAIAGSPVVDAWPGFKKMADQYANEFNSSSNLSYNPATGGIIGGTLSGNPATGHENVPRNYARILGLAWLITADSKYSTAALKYADLLIAIPVNAGNDVVRAARVEALGLLYDYFHDVAAMVAKQGQFVQKVKETVARYEPDGVTENPVNSTLCGPGYYFTLGNTICRGMYSTYPDRAGPSPTIGSGHNHSVNAALSAGIFGLLDAPDADLESILYMTHLNFTNGFNPARRWIAEDGGFHMSWGYSAWYNQLSFILAWNTATDLDMTEDWQSKLIYMYIYGLRGDFNYVSGGNGAGSADPELTKAFSWWSSVKAADGYAQRFYRRWLMPSFSNAFFDLVLERPGLAEAPLEDLPYSRLFRNAGRVLMRDSWDYPNSSLVEFKSAPFYHLGHDHMDQNSFSIFYKAPLLVDSGYYDNYNSPHWHNYYIRSIAHNLITIWEPGECFTPTFPAGYGCAANDGGQKHFQNANPSLADIQAGGSNHLDGVTAYEYSTDYTYTVGNASKAYSSSKLDQNSGFVRSLLYLRTSSFWSKPITVVFDKVTASAAGAGLTKRFLLHTVNEPVPPGVGAVGPGIHDLPGSIMEVRNGSGMLFSQTLLPENAVIRKIGGKDSASDYRFLAPSKTASDYQTALVNFAPSPDPDASSTDNVISADMGNWRVEVTAPIPSRREYFLHVLSLADNDGITVPPSAVNLSSDSAAVALLANQQHLVFAKLDAPATVLQWNTPAPSANSLVTGLAGNQGYSGYVIQSGLSTAPYTIVLQVDVAGPLRSSSQGVLNITSPLPMDLDDDGFLQPQDCDDSNAAVYPDALEVPNNGRDEDCAGGDSTICVKFAVFNSGASDFTVEATYAGATKNGVPLVVEGYNAMSWNTETPPPAWRLEQTGVNQKPESILISGPGGTILYPDITERGMGSSTLYACENM